MIHIAIPILSLLLMQEARIAVVDFERALAECAEGKQAAEKWNKQFEARKKEIDEKQKALESDENKLRTQERVLNDAIKADLTRSIERQRRDLTRINEDAQKELETLREDLLRPIAEKASAVMKAYAGEQGFTLVIDISAGTNVVYVNQSVNVTAELIRRIDAIAKPQPATKPPGK